MACDPIRHGLDLHLVDGLPEMEVAQGHRQPFGTGCGLDLHPVGEAALGELDIVIVNIGVRLADLFEHAYPGKEHRL
jgi:hypothetical protein